MRATGAVLLGVIAGLAVLPTGTAAYAESLLWHFRSDHANIVSLEFYSQNRGHVWPGDDQVYVIDDYDVHDYPLECQPGEKICYGAWVRNDSSSYWGAGYDGVQACENCCYTCDGGQTDIIVLAP